MRSKMKSFLPLLVTDPELGFIRIHAGPMGAVVDLLARLGISREDTVDDLACLQVDDVEPSMLAEANVGTSIGAVHSEGEYARFTNWRNGLKYLAVARPELSQGDLGSQVDVFPIEAGDAVMGPFVDRDLIDLFAIGGINHDESVLSRNATTNRSARRCACRPE